MKEQEVWYIELPTGMNLEYEIIDLFMVIGIMDLYVEFSMN